MTREGSDYQRWYDADPALARALESLRQAPDRYQAQVALNIIKIIVEHRIEAASGSAAETMEQLMAESGSSASDRSLRRRWYDVNETLHSAMHLLRDCPDDLQQSVIPSIARMIEQTLNERL
ncbi:MAG: hypothetical protein SFZ03_07960 [Candidatus Melainabacteria bacterium]|nr:hypothetical protein [Candidatus Melainabacteria bacterium]